MSDSNNSSLNNLFANFLNVEPTVASDGNTQSIYNFDNTINMVCIDTYNHRIGINTLDPTCSLDISGTNGKIIVNSISCENLDVSGKNVYNELTQLDNNINSIKNSILQESNDASFTNVDISGILDLSSSNASLNIVSIDNSVNLVAFGLYYDASGFVRIKLP